MSLHAAIQRIRTKPLTRRHALQWLAAGAGALSVGADRAAAQAPAPAAPPSTVTTPPRDFGPNGAPHDLFLGPRRHRRRSELQWSGAAQRTRPAPVDRRALVGGAGVERARPVPRLERHPKQSSAAVARG